jgi:2,5-diamino-6-(ribosylamino)-4(3H)-pyrimidinone 5'-phosphate reductase
LTDTVTRLYPLPPREIPAGSIYADLELPPHRRHDPGRPYVIINMVGSVDGKTSVDGKAAGLGSRIDRQTMRNLRARADAVMIGANTLRAEKLSLGLDDTRGPQPLAVVVTASGELPLDNLLLPERQKLLVIGPQPVVGRFGPERALAIPASPSGTIDLEAALSALRTEYAVELLLVEGGPTLNHALISAGLADELFRTVAPTLVGPTHGEAVHERLPTEPSPASLRSVYLADNELFLRYALQPDHQTNNYS